MPPQKIILSHKQVQDIIGKYKGGLTIEKTSQFFNVPIYAVRRVLLRNDISTNKYRLPRMDKMKILPEHEKIIVQLYNDGLSTPKIAKEFNVTPFTILSALKRNNVSIRKSLNTEKKPSNKEITKENVPEIICFYQSGIKVKEITLKFDTYTSTIKNVLKTNGVYKICSRVKSLKQKTSP